MSLNNPKTGISIVGQLLGAVVEKSQDQKYTNYRLGIATETRPDKFGKVSEITNEIELTEYQYQRYQFTINVNLKQAVRIWVDLDHRAGEKNGRVWDILNLRMRPDSEIEFLNSSAVVQSSSEHIPTTDKPLAIEPKPESEIPEGIKKFK